MQAAGRHWALALSGSVLIHIGVVAAILWQPPESGARSAGMGGVEVSLGPAGGAPGGEAQPVEAFAEAEAVKPTETAATRTPPAEAAVEPPEPVPPEQAQLVEAAKPSETPVETVPVEDSAPVEVAETAPVETMVEVVERRLPLPAEAAPPEEVVAKAVVAPPLPTPKPRPPELTRQGTALAPQSAPEQAQLVEAAKPSETPVETVPVEDSAPVEVAETAPVETMVEVVERRSPLPAEAAPPEEVVEHRPPLPVEAAPPEEVVAKAVVAPPLPTPKPRPPELTRQETALAPQSAPEPARRTAEVLEPTEEQTAAVTPTVSGTGGKAGTQVSPEAGSADASSGGGMPGATANYMALLRAWFERHKEYPRRAQMRGQEGTALLYFVMDRDGRVIEFRLQQSSGHDLLDREVAAMIERAQPLPKMPDEMRQTRLKLVVPVQFLLW